METKIIGKDDLNTAAALIAAGSSLPFLRKRFTALHAADLTLTRSSRFMRSRADPR